MAKMAKAKERSKMRVALRRPLLLEPWPVGVVTPARPCPVCGKEWRPWASSRLPCHGRCLLEEWAQDELLAVSRGPKWPGVATMATRLGVPTGVITAAIKAAKRRDAGMGRAQ